MKTTTTLLALALFCASAPAAFADCVDGNRDRTAQEQAFADKLIASLKAALPAAPAPLALEREPQVVLQPPCKGTPVGVVNAMVSADYAASAYYSDRTKLTLRANFAYPGPKDVVLGAMPKKPAGFKLHNLVVSIDGYKAQYIDALGRAIDRDRLQTLIDQPLPDTPPPAAWTVATPGAAAPRAEAAARETAAPSSSATAQPAAADRRGPPAPAADPAQAVADQAKEAVNKLRGLFGR